MNRADPFFERDATGWQFINMDSGNADINYVLPNNRNRVVGYDESVGAPVDREYQPENKRTPPQKHY